MGNDKNNHFMKIFVGFLFILINCLLPSTVFALSDQQKMLYDLGINYFDASASASSSCSGTTVTPGSGAPDGAQFPNLDPNAMANAINTWVASQNPNSELKGLGSTIVADAKNSNINPFLIVAIAKSESSLADPSDFNTAHANNAFGREATSSQPHFEGSHTWYKWTSVKASVDYTAPENVNATGGGDIATYIRNVYGSQLDSNNLAAMITKYAPPGENDTAGYIARVQSWISDLTNLTDGKSQNPTPTTTTSACGSGGHCSNGATGTAAILCEAQKYDGIYYSWGGGHESYDTFRQICPEEAIATAAASSTAANPGPCATDCSGLVSVAVDAAYNQSYTWSVSGSMTGAGSSYWKKVAVADTKAGDIVTTSEHVEIVDHVDGNTIYTFGSHYTGSKTGKINTSLSYWSGAYTWTGPGGGSQ